MRTDSGVTYFLKTVFGAMISLLVVGCSFNPAFKSEPPVEIPVVEQVSEPITEVAEKVEPAIVEHVLVFDKMREFETRTPELIARSASEAQLHDSLKIHQCWCWAIKVLEYEPETFPVGETVLGQYIVRRDSATNDLIFKEKDGDVVSWYIADEEVTFSMIKGGNYALRYLDKSIYFWNDGTVDMISVVDGVSHVLYQEGVVTDAVIEGTTYTYDEFLVVRDYALARVVHSALDLKLD